METVSEHESPRSAATSALEQERLRMQSAVKKAATTPEQPQAQRGGRRPNVAPSAGPVRRGPARSTSLRQPAKPMAPTKSNDALASMRGNAAARANSSRALLRAASSSNILGRGGVGRTASATAGIRPYSRDQIVNTSIQRAHSGDGSIKLMARCAPGGSTLDRQLSEMSLGDFSQSTTADNSIFTMDSVNLRKTQMVADPLENEGTYDEDDSFADHESFVTRESDATFFRQQAQSHNTVLTFDDLEAMRMRERLHISAEESSQFSFGTIGSGLTTDFTEDHEESEYLHDETQYAE